MLANLTRKEAFYSVKIDPDSLIKQVVEGKESYEFEGFWYVAMNAFKNKTGEELFSLSITTGL